MVKYKIVYDRNGCIGAGACVGMSPNDFEMANDGKADLKQSQDENGNFVKIIDEKDYKAALDAADACPVAIIKIVKLEEK